MRLNFTRFCKVASSPLSRLSEKEFFVDAHWGKIAGLTWGQSTNKPIILCHGKLDSAAVFRPLVNLLPDNYYYIAIEYPGNGKSDHLPKGVPLSVLDFVPTVKCVADEFRLKSFAYMGHSLGAHVGKYYQIAYPDEIKAVIDLDPAPAYMSHDVDTLHEWYHYFYGTYYDKEKYSKFNSPRENAPSYTYDQAVQLMIENRGLTEAGAHVALERTLEPAGGGKYRFVFDQRLKIVIRPPFPPAHLRTIYTSSRTPTLGVVGEESLARGWFGRDSFVTRPDAWSGNYDVIVVAGNHDVHISHPERMSDRIAEFLKNNY